jgi:hypothetical protein
VDREAICVPVAYRGLDAVGGDSPGRALGLAVRVWLCRTRLDRELAEGANPTTDAARGLRAQQLSSRRSRRHLAAGLRWLVKRAHQPTRSPWDATVPVNRVQVHEARELLLMLATRLDEPGVPNPRAVALASFLLTDPWSPASLLFDDSDGPLNSSYRATTAQLARAALEAIDQRPLR